MSIEVGEPILDRLFYRNREKDIVKNSDGSYTLILGVISTDFYLHNRQFFETINVTMLFGELRMHVDGYRGHNWKTLTTVDLEKVCLQAIGYSVEPVLLVGHDQPDRYVVRVQFHLAGTHHCKEMLANMLACNDVTLSARLLLVLPEHGGPRTLKQLVSVDVVY